MSDQVPGGAIAKRDEVLQLLYWIEGEGFGGSSTLAGLARFLAYEPADVAAVLDELVGRGDVRRSVEDEFRLTEAGRREAARRFAEEFAPMLSQGHGECSDPNCDCQTSPGGAAECHARVHSHEHD